MFIGISAGSFCKPPVRGYPLKHGSSGRDNACSQSMLELGWLLPVDDETSKTTIFLTNPVHPGSVSSIYVYTQWLLPSHHRDLG